MVSRIPSAISNTPYFSTAQTFSSALYSKLDNHPVYIKVTDTLSNTRTSITSTFSSSTNYIYSLPNSIESQFYAYTSMLQPVDDSEEREIKTSPNDHLEVGVIELNSEREEICNHILSLYGCKPTKECFKHYDDNVLFEDPFMHADGLPNVKAQFYGMPKLFTKSTTDDYKVLQNDPNVLKIDLNQRYVLPFINRAVVQNSQITLEFNTENKKIIKHIDRWNGRPIGKGEMFRKGAARIVSALIWVPED